MCRLLFIPFLAAKCWFAFSLYFVLFFFLSVWFGEHFSSGNVTKLYKARSTLMGRWKYFGNAFMTSFGSAFIVSTINATANGGNAMSPASSLASTCTDVSWAQMSCMSVSENPCFNKNVWRCVRMFNKSSEYFSSKSLPDSIYASKSLVTHVKHVIDTGKVKTMSYDASMDAKQLVLGEISKASADQRAGRTGRTESGTCYRMYSKSTYDQMKSKTTAKFKYVSENQIVRRRPKHR